MLPFWSHRNSLRGCVSANIDYHGTSFESIPAGIAASVGAAGLAQIFSFIDSLELAAVMKG
jgi:hypothetical protein